MVVIYTVSDRNNTSTNKLDSGKTAHPRSGAMRRTTCASLQGSWDRGRRVREPLMRGAVLESCFLARKGS